MRQDARDELRLREARDPPQPSLATGAGLDLDREHPVIPRQVHPRRRHQRRQPRCYSHSIVAGGLPVMSYTTRLMPFTSLTMRREQVSSSS